MTPETPETDSTLAVKGLQPELSVKAHAGSGFVKVLNTTLSAWFSHPCNDVALSTTITESFAAVMV